MPRARKRDWQPKGLEIFDTSDLISDEALVSLITQRFGISHSQKKLEKLQRRLRGITGLLRGGLHYRARPTPGEISAGLKPLAERVAATIAALETLDADARRLLEHEADQSIGEVEIIVDGEQVGYQVGAGALGIYEIRCGLKVLKKWIEAAEEKLPSKPPRKIKLDDERIAVSSLLTLWKMASEGTTLAADPTIGPFTGFVDEVLMPVLKACNAETSLKGIISEVLYGK
jgi:hypothetical protein